MGALITVRLTHAIAPRRCCQCVRLRLGRGAGGRSGLLLTGRLAAFERVGELCAARALGSKINFLLHRTAKIAAMHARVGIKVDHLMSVIERLLVPGSTELPRCQCGDEMRVT